jgi:hypothetical protein
MDTQGLRELLGGLSGHLVTDSPQMETEGVELHKLLARALLPEDVREIKRSSFAFEQSDLFHAENIPAARAEMIRAVAERRAAGEAEAEFRVFAREVPVRSTQLHASTPLWAGGAAVERTLGPFRHADGRQFWFDFIRIERLVALYVQGSTDPALLFMVPTTPVFVDRNRPFAADSTTRYELVAGSVWINSRLLAANAPAGYYTGLTINGGTVSLSALPEVLGGKLTAAKTAVVRVKLQLRQPDVMDADPTSPYGVDAREVTLQLPAQLAFHFSGAAGSTFDEVSESAWNVYGDSATFRWDAPRAGGYDVQLHRVLIPLVCSAQQFEVRDARSPFNTLSGRAGIKASAWALPAAPIDVAHPSAAAGVGGLSIMCERGLATTWQKLENGPRALTRPSVLVEPGRISVTDLQAGEMVAQQTFELWRDKQNPCGTRVRMQYPKGKPFFYFTFADGNELLAALGDADAQIDRPVNVVGEPPPVKSKNMLLLLAVGKALRFVYLFDDNILLDNLDPTQKSPALPPPIAFALKNALFKVTPANACLLFGYLAEDLVKVERGWLYLTFGLYAYLPTLPDPYAANLGCLKQQFRGQFFDPATGARYDRGGVWSWLVCQVSWRPAAQPETEQVNASFHFAPLDARTGRAADLLLTTVCREMLPARPADAETVGAGSLLFKRNVEPLPNYGVMWYEQTQRLQADTFALLDVSTNADLLGVSFGPSVLDDPRSTMLRTHIVAPAENQQAAAESNFPIQVRGLDVVSRSGNVRAFTVPQISWEPVYNLTPPPEPAGPVVVQGIFGETLVPPTNSTLGDPPVGFNYYPDDGGPMRIINNGVEQVTLAPIPLSEFMVESFRDERFFALAMFGLPFGMKALALLQNKYPHRRGTRVDFDQKKFADELETARRLRVRAGAPEAITKDDMFIGSTVQLNNLLRQDGSSFGESTLGGSVTEIFNNEFFNNRLGVPLTRIDISGYGASIFSNWFDREPLIATTSQAKFDVFLGRCAQEIIQVFSIMYPWGCKVVRTITLFRTNTGYEYRIDSGWRAQSDGLFDFTHKAYVPGPSPKGTKDVAGLYEIHPTVVKGLFNIREIKETDEVRPYEGDMTIGAGEKYIQGNGDLVTNGVSPLQLHFKLQPVFFNADVEIENPLSGHFVAPVNGRQKNLVPSKRILGFVQILPLGQPLTVAALRDLCVRQGNIGGPLDCLVNIGASGQRMRVNRFYLTNSYAADGAGDIFTALVQGSVILPKDGSWSMVKHEHANGAVSPVPPETSVPLIRAGKITQATDPLQVTPAPSTELLRIANPTELLRAPTSGTKATSTKPATPPTLNFGFLHSTDTQKALFLNPAFQQGVQALLSKTPPLFADAFRVVNSKGIFPNVGDAISNFGDVLPLRDPGAFDPLSPGSPVMKLMQIDKVTAGVRQEGYKLLKNFAEFKLPADAEWDLISVGSFRIYITYKAENVKAPDGGTPTLNGGLNFDVDSFAGAVGDRWKSRMKNVALVVDLEPIKKLMTIKGNWDAKKGTEAQYGGGGAGEVPQPQIEFAKELEPVMALLDILEKLQTKDYSGAFGSGVRLAMSNKANSWEYKFEAAKEIPVLRFPPGPLYFEPTAPFKLEAGLKLGAYFNAALQVPADPKQLLPSAGAYLGFYGRLSVMCVSLAAATVYAVGQVNLDIGCDTKTKTFMHMKFGFGAQLVVGLPVVGNVSVLYMVGVEIYTDSTQVQVSAFLLFQGHAELLAGLVGVTITIEAKGTYTRTLAGADSRTDLAAQVTFGIDISIFLVIDISFSKSWEETRQIA